MVVKISIAQNRGSKQGVELKFLDGPVVQLCEMIDNWVIVFEERRLRQAPKPGQMPRQ